MTRPSVAIGQRIRELFMQMKYEPQTLRLLGTVLLTRIKKWVARCRPHALPARVNTPPDFKASVSPDGRRLVLTMQDAVYYMRIELPADQASVVVDMGIDVVMNQPDVVMEFYQLLEYECKPEMRMH